MSLNELIGTLVLSGTTAGAAAFQTLPPAPVPESPPITAPTTSVAGLSPAQLAEAMTIVSVGREKRVPDEGIVIAIATAMRESRLGEQTCCDHDSKGNFQQRPSMGWGSPEELTNPRIAAGKFYDALLNVDGWQEMELTDAAQEVQVSAHPTAYAKDEPAAREVASALGVNASG